MEPTDAHIQHLREMLTDAITASTQDMHHMRFTKEDLQHQAVVTIYATIVQSCRECVTVLAQPSVAAGGMIRSVVESYADLCAAIRDPGYVENMHATLFFETLRLLRNMVRTPDNPFHGDLSTKIDVAGLSAKIKDKLAFLKNRDRKPLKNFQRFERGGLQDIYESMYWNLCQAGHNSIGALERRHIVRRDGDLLVVPLQRNSNTELALFFDALTATLLDCSYRVHTFLNTKLAHNYIASMEELNAFRAEVHAAAPPDTDVG